MRGLELRACFSTLFLYSGHDGGDGPGYVTAEVDLAEVDKARGMIAALRHDRDYSLEEAAPLREAARFEERISALVASDPELGEYVRQLKKREFAQ